MLLQQLLLLLLPVAATVDVCLQPHCGVLAFLYMFLVIMTSYDSMQGL